MAEFPYTQNTASIGRLFAQIHSGVGKPSKVSLKWLAGIGFPGTNDRRLTAILKTLNFIDDSGAPTEKWSAYRDKEKSPAVIAQALREGYSNLFETYPDAYRKDDEALRNFFSTHTGVGAQAVSYMVRTFKALVELADFEAASPEVLPKTEDSNPKRADRAPLDVVKTSTHTETPTTRELTINLNIQLQLPATEDATIYDKLFESLYKHILSKSSK